VGKDSQTVPFLDQRSSNLGSRLTNIFPIVDIMFRCREMFGQSSKSVPKRGKCPESSDQIFQMTVISQYVSKFGWNPFGVHWPEFRRRKESRSSYVCFSFISVLF